MSERKGRTAPEKSAPASKSLREFESHIQVRRLRIEDYDALVALQAACFPGMKPWKREQIESQLRVFPEGQFVVERRGEVVASATSLIVNFDHYAEWHDWHKVSDSGYIRNHDPKGDTLYGIEIMVHPGSRGLKLSRRLYDARKDLARQMNLRRIIIGGRIPGYGAHAETLSASEYVRRVKLKELVDPVLTSQLANDFHLERLIPGYLPSDSDSRGWATFLEWTNLDFKGEDALSPRPSPQVRIAAVQYLMRRIASWEEFAGQCEFFCDLASSYRSDFVLFPELLTTQLLSLMPTERPGIAARKLAEFTPRYIELFRDLAVRFNVNIVGGSHFVVEEGVLLNVSYLFRRNGTIDRQEKIHVTPNEQRWWGASPGKGVRVFETDRGKVAILICYDIEFPELARVACAMGATIIFVPFNTDERHGYLRVRVCAQARAIENQCYVAISGCAGLLPQVENADIHYSQSAVFTPSDFPFARDALAGEATPNIETLVVADVDLEVARRARLMGTVRPFTDRRTDVYRLRYRDEDGQEMEF